MDTLHHRLIGQQALVDPTLTDDLFRLQDTCADASVDGKLQSPTRGGRDHSFGLASTTCSDLWLFCAIACL
jgi:hypothetical protein